MQRPDLVTLGKITGIWGVHGWVRIYSYTRKKQDIFSFNPWYLLRGDSYDQIHVLQGRTQGSRMVARLEGYTEREQARSLIDTTIAVPMDVLPELNHEEYYWIQLQGLRVVTVNDEDLGTVDFLMETGANDVMVVRGDRERLIPYIPDVIRQVSLGEGLIRVDWDVDF
jgi:16S rRNA processing protein RimM